MKVLVSLGGNAILKHGQKGTVEEQEMNVQNTAKHLAAILRRGERMVITHGNGPQVGNILLQNEIAKETLPPMPLDVCGAESQGMIGYMLQRALRSELESGGQNVPVATIVSQTLVDAEDPAFKNPTKPVGPFYTATEARQLRESKGGLAGQNPRSGDSPHPDRRRESVHQLWEAGSARSRQYERARVQEVSRGRPVPSRQYGSQDRKRGQFPIWWFRGKSGYCFFGKGRRGPKRNRRDHNYELVRRATAIFRLEK